jgi:hypothetical protein
MQEQIPSVLWEKIFIWTCKNWTKMNNQVLKSFVTEICINCKPLLQQNVHLKSKKIVHGKSCTH